MVKKHGNEDFTCRSGWLGRDDYPKAQHAPNTFAGRPSDHAFDGGGNAFEAVFDAGAAEGALFRSLMGEKQFPTGAVAP